jgi:formylglycine-generating enzyme required for sulfatase activity
MGISIPEQEATREATAKVFISYSRKDMAFADRLEVALRKRGFEPLIDRTHVYAFEEWWKRVENLIASADTLVFVLSPDAIRPGTTALKEVEFAASLNKRFAPIIFRPVDEKCVPEALAKFNFIFFTDQERFDESADNLAKALNTNINWIRQHTDLGDQARRWSLAERPNGLLLRSPYLEQSEFWMSSRPKNAPAPTPETLAYIEQSRRATNRQKTNRRFIQSIIYTLLVGIIIVLVGWINQVYIGEQWHWWTVTRPYMVSQVRPYVLTTAHERALKQGDSFKECATDCPEMIVVPVGSFMMGSPPTEKGREAREGPQHTVRFSKPFAVSKYLVTFADWDACVTVGGCNDYKPNDTGWGRGQRPVINVSWNDAQQYVAWLSKVTGKAYRLLSESEYEYATRAGTTTAYPWGNDIGKNNANCNGCGSQWDAKQTAPVGSFAPNRFDLYDMVGNVFEWTEDCVHDNYNGAPMDGSAWSTDGDCGNRLVRGGSWLSDPDYLRSADRIWLTSDRRDSGLGFRVGRTLLVP